MGEICLSGSDNKYIIAMTNLYGMVPKEKAVEIYNSQNEVKIGIDVIEAYLTNPPKELEEAFIYPYKDCFVHETILEFDEFDQMLRKKVDKPYYVPEKKELLKYTDEWYFEKNSQYKALFNYVKANFFKGVAKKAEELCEEIQGTCHPVCWVRKARKVGIKMKKQLGKFLKENPPKNLTAQQLVIV